MRGITSNFELINLAKILNIPLTAIIYKNELYKFNPDEDCSFIIDLHDKEDPSTGHWVALTKKDNKFIYFDSFGIIYPLAIYNFCKDYPIQYNTKQIQSLSTEWCGGYCLAFLWHMRTGNLQQFIDKF